MNAFWRQTAVCASGFERFSMTPALLVFIPSHQPRRQGPPTSTSQSQKIDEEIRAMARHSLTPFQGGLIRGDPFLQLHREMNRLFDDVFRGGGLPAAEGQSGSALLAPQIDVSETGNELRIYAELPGVKEDGIDVTLDGDVLTIRGEKSFEHKDEKENYHFMERSYGTFQRSIRIPYHVDPDAVKADFRNGVLTVTLPKSQQQERSRRIQVQGHEKGQSDGGQKDAAGSQEASNQGEPQGARNEGPGQQNQPSDQDRGDTSPQAA
jgi:HSP20 family protein